MKSGTCFKTRMTLTELKTLLLNTDGFVAIGASYIVNLRCVQSLLPAAVVMADGERSLYPGGCAAR